VAENGERSADEVPSRLGKYRVLGIAGKWARGFFLRGYDEVLDREVLLKTLSAEGAGDPEARARFEREAKAAASLQHVNIIDIKDLGEHRGIFYMAFEALEGQTLSECMNRGLSLKNGLPIMLQVLDGLTHMHSHGFVHRDVTPSGVFVCTDGGAKLFDLWVATCTDWYESGTIMGTLHAASRYVAPEQVRGEGIDGRCDLFSAGCVIYEMVVGRRPFDSDNSMAVLYKVTHEEPDWGLLPSGPHWEHLSGAIRRALQKPVELRYPDANAMRADLLNAMQELAEDANWIPRRSHMRP
jgi:serine/threonine protein kinase